jgi:hypothetical protein
MLNRSSNRLALLAAALLCVTYPSNVFAHAAPAVPPEFVPGDCITVVDKSTQSSVDLSYTIAFDDVVFGPGDIRLPDSKTHQFFAFAAGVSPRGFEYNVNRFDTPGADPIPLPKWITVDEVKRAAKAAGGVDGTTFTTADVPPGAVLDSLPELFGLWQRITPDDARVPITIEQAKTAVRWDLGDVAPGLYSIAAYIFSPPFNGWAIRPGLIKVVEGPDAAPAVVIDQVREFVFAYQGRQVKACIDALDASRIRGYMRVEERPEAGWIEWLKDTPVDGDSLSLCFHNPRPELTGSVRLRFDIVDPKGRMTSVYSSDTITALDGDGECVPSDTLCCDFPRAAAMPVCDAGTRDAGCAADAASDDGAAEHSTDSGVDGGASGAAGSAKLSGCGCSVLRSRGPVPSVLAALSSVVALQRVRRRRVRRNVAERVA